MTVTAKRLLFQEAFDLGAGGLGVCIINNTTTTRCLVLYVKRMYNDQLHREDNTFSNTLTNSSTSSTVL